MKSSPKPMLFEFSFPMSISVETVWNYLSNTDKMNRSVGYPKVEYTEEPDVRGGSKLYGRVVNAKFFVSEYLEHPFDWVENRYLVVQRDFIRGPMKQLTFKIEAEKTETGFNAKFMIKIIPASFIFRPAIYIEVKNSMIPAFRESMKNLEKYAEKKTDYPLFPIDYVRLSDDPKKLEDVTGRLMKLKGNDELKRKSALYILDSPDVELLKIKPNVMADRMGEKRKETLELLLRAAKAGYFNMNWDILCPSCRGAKSSSNHLSELADQVHCPSCNIDYGPEFDKSVELTFTPTPILREVFGGLHCFGGPGSTPHIRTQLKVYPNEIRMEEMDFHKGSYRVFSLQRKEVLFIDVMDLGEDTNEVKYPSDGRILMKPGKKTLVFENHDESGFITVKVEKSAFDDAVTAYEVTAMQEFRDLFSSEILRPGQEIAIQSIAVLFTDLKGSTKFYNDRGDNFAYKLVGDHFEILSSNASKFEGAVVKTIGDAIMGVFVSPLQALKFAVQTQRDIKDLNRKIGEELIFLKIGIHFGPALAVTMNEKLDYFGSTVNLAARTEGQCLGGDVVITKKLYEYPGVTDFLGKLGARLEQFSANLKGFSTSMEMIRISL